MTFKSNLSVDAIAAFLNTDEFAEVIAYTPSGGAAKNINAIVIRDRVDSDVSDGGRSLQNRAEIFIAKDATNGVTSINKGNDTVVMVDQYGTSKTWLVIDLVVNDDGMWHLLMRL